ncbi:MAG: GNAT family N-acetyltransferase [Parachlamydiaceae bacterium]|nr:GNAT family N-acetyltransferase [Parachlamydiaceae bacterium]
MQKKDEYLFDLLKTSTLQTAGNHKSQSNTSTVVARQTKLNLHIRPAKPEEIDILYALVCELALFEGKDVTSLSLTKENLFKFGFSKNPYYHTELAIVDGNIVGYALYFYTFSANQGFPILYLEDLYLKEEYRKQGIGYQMLKKLAQHAKDHQCCRLEWHVFSWNELAIRLYQKLGGFLKDDLIQVRLERESFENITDN